MLHVSFLFLLLVCIESLPYRLKNSNMAIEIKAFRSTNDLELTMTITGGEGQQFSIVSELLSPEHKQHRVSLSNGQIKIFPEINRSNILVRDFQDNTYYLGLKHEVGLKKVHFLPIRIVHRNQQNEFFLPSFDFTVPFLPEESFYRCDQVLVSLQYKQKEGSLQEIQAVLFTKNSKRDNFYLGEEWDQAWRHYDDGIYFGGGLKTQNTHQKLSVTLSNSKICEINLDSLPKPGSLEHLHKYHEIEDLLKWVPALPFVQLEQL